MTMNDNDNDDDNTNTQTRLIGELKLAHGTDKIADNTDDDTKR